MYLKPSRQRKTLPQTIGFDVETHDNNREFTCGSFAVSDSDYQFFTDPDDMISELSHQKYQGTYIVATNLTFDFFKLLFGRKAIQKFQVLFRGSDLLYAKTWTKGGEFFSHTVDKHQPITFIDTFNYAKLSVKKMGAMIGTHKLETPSFIGEEPQTPEEWDYLKRYNIRDSVVSKSFMDYLFNAFYSLGGSPKKTLASTAMSIFRNRFLNTIYFQHSIPDLLNQFKAYHGGRCEAFNRGFLDGTDKKYYYADYNSLYPAVMCNEYADPNTMRKNKLNTTRYIENYHGVACVDIRVPYGTYTLLPVRTDHKLLFPYGTFERQWYSNMELVKAMELGYEITHVHQNMYFTGTCFPFKEFQETMFSLRQKYKGTPMEKVVKLVSNSLYGKTGQRFWGRDNFVPLDQIEDMLDEGIESFEVIQSFARIKQKMGKPAPFCIPIWALETTSRGRIKLFDALRRHKAVYCDTDSIVTKDYIENSNKLGELKVEMRIKEGIVVRPKFYGFLSDQEKEIIRIKGLPMSLSYDHFKSFVSPLASPVAITTKFLKVKEALRRNLIPGMVVPTTKVFNLEDSKRIWPESFACDYLQSSEPIEIRDGLLPDQYNKAMDYYDTIHATRLNSLIASDHFDRASVASDDTAEDFIRREMQDALH